jgi:hypothetical protein
MYDERVEGQIGRVIYIVKYHTLNLFPLISISLSLACVVSIRISRERSLLTKESMHNYDTTCIGVYKFVQDAEVDMKL